MGNNIKRTSRVTPQSSLSLQSIKLNQLKKRKSSTKHQIQYLDQYGTLTNIDANYWNFDTISAIDHISYLLLDSGLNNKKSLELNEITQLIINGIPFEYRHSLWKYLSNFNSIKQQYPNPDEYYQQLLDKNKESECRGHSTILADIPRTFPLHKFFQLQSTKDKLYRILTAFAIHRPDIGYVQGLNYMVSLLLFHFDEQDTFWMLLAFMKKLNLFEYYFDDMDKLQRSSANLGDSISANFPKLVDKLENVGVLPITYTTPYFLTLFTYNCPLSICAHLWDLILFSDIIFKHNIPIEQFIKDFILLYVDIKHNEWKKLLADELMPKLRIINIEQYEMSIIMQQIIASHELEKESVVKDKLLFILEMDDNNDHFIDDYSNKMDERMESEESQQISNFELTMSQNEISNSENEPSGSNLPVINEQITKQLDDILSKDKEEYPSLESLDKEPVDQESVDQVSACDCCC